MFVNIRGAEQWITIRFVIHGADDYATPAALARSYFDRTTAPRKAFVLIPGGHTALVDSAEQFLAALNEQVRPLADQRNPIPAEPNPDLPFSATRDEVAR